LLDRADLSDERIVSGFSRALSDDNQQVRHIALQVVQRFPDDTVIAQAAELAAMATNSQESVANRLAVIRRLQKLEQRAASGAAAFQKAAREDANLAIRKACVVAAARVSEPEEAVRFLGEFCATEKDVQLRRLALVRLGRSATPAAAPHLAAALGASEEVIREAAANGLVTLGGASTEPLRRRLSDKNPQTRQLAVYCLGKIGGAARAAVPDLQKRVDDESEVQSTRDLARLVIQSISQVP
ncbi:MAG: HEAT repeat domain-containing protein, partial [Pirellulaceae bacterium]|nr:HEAT repeat domain-containing protein [Pirellulaceae bacterium]